jgi:predicted RNA-binding Zn-ribbon protein involved in translation (DUF1610 family)
MTNITNGTGDHISIATHNVDLPRDDADRTELLRQVESAVEDVLADHGLEPSHLTLYDGHMYSQIKNRCPQCGERVTIYNLHLGHDNGATAEAKCECGWKGKATYRLIDFTEDISDQDVSTDNALFNYASCVRLYDIDPLYTYY